MTTLKSLSSKKGKKGFTLTELAIVIAVIAILIAVLVPTFTSVITSARKTSALSNAKNAITEYTTQYYSYPDDGAVIVDGSDYYVVYNSTASDTYTAVASSDYDSEYGSSSSYVKIANATLLYTAETAVIYGTDANNTSLTEKVKNTIANNIASVIETPSIASTYSAGGYTIYVTDGYYWWSVTVAVNTSASINVQLTKKAIAADDNTTSTPSYVATLTAVDTSDTTKWTEPSSEAGYDVTSLTTDSGTCYMYTLDMAAVVKAGMATIESPSAGTYYVKAADANSNVYYYSITYTADSTNDWGDATLLTVEYGNASETKVEAISGYTGCSLEYKTEEAVAEEAALAISVTETLSTEETSGYCALVTVGEKTYYFKLSYTDSSWSVSSAESSNYDSEGETTATTSYSGFTVKYNTYKDSETE